MRRECRLCLNLVVRGFTVCAQCLASLIYPDPGPTLGLLPELVSVDAEAETAP